MLKIECYKGAGVDDCMEIELDEQATLAQLRKILLGKGFITEDSDDKAYRFLLNRIDKNITHINLNDVIVPYELESVIFVATTYKADNGKIENIVLTNINAKDDEKPDLIGYKCNKWINNLLSVSCVLNRTDETAIIENEKINNFNPIMMYDVISTSKVKMVAYPNVCICLENSVVEFHLNSWGAAGYEFQISNSAGGVIVESLFRTYDGVNSKYGSFGDVHCRCWEKEGKTIKIVGADTLPINKNEVVRYQKITIKTRNLISYKRGKVGFSSDETPPVLYAVETRGGISGNSVKKNRLSATRGANSEKKEFVHVDGDSINPSVPVQGKESSQTFGLINSTKTGPWEEPLGVVEIYFFVFKTKEEAERTIKGLNSIDPDFWD